LLAIYRSILTLIFLFPLRSSFPGIRGLGQLLIGLLAIVNSLCCLIGGAFYRLMAILIIAVIAYLFKMAFNTGSDVVNAVNPAAPILLDDASPTN
jgi:hypothetical protein